MEDLFDREQKILDNAVEYMEEVYSGASINIEMFENLVFEYGRLLRQLRRVTRISDRTTYNLNTSNLDLTDKVHYDSLTGIYNRRFMEENLKRIIKTMSRMGGGLLSVLMLDVDYFKLYNDTYGHSMGDKCLKAIAGAIKDAIRREDDFVARYGGEEFIAVLPNTDEEGARVMAERIADNLAKLNIAHDKNSVSDRVTISIGVTTGEVGVWGSSQFFVKKADEALYAAKRGGRNRYVFIGLDESPD